MTVRLVVCVHGWCKAGLHCVPYLGRREELLNLNLCLASQTTSPSGHAKPMLGMQVGPVDATVG